METKSASSTPPRQRSTSPSLLARKVWSRVPPPEQLWQESLYSEDLPTFGPSDTPDAENDLMSMVSSTMRELQKSTRSQKERHATFQVDTDNYKRRFIEKAVKRALEEGQEARKSDEDPERQREASYRRVETEAPRTLSREMSPQVSERTRGSPPDKLARSTSKRLTEELRIAQEKYQKLEEMYSVLLARKQPRDDYRKKFEDLREKLVRDQGVWGEKLKTLQRQVSEKTEECRRLAGELQRTQHDDLQQMKKDLEALRTRVEHTEEDNELIKAKVFV